MDRTRPSAPEQEPADDLGLEAVDAVDFADVLFAAHDLNRLLEVLDRIVYILDGRPIAGTPDEVVRSDLLSRLYRDGRATSTSLRMATALLTSCRVATARRVSSATRSALIAAAATRP